MNNGLKDRAEKMLLFAQEHPELTFFIWCKNCEHLLGIVTGWNCDWVGKYWDKNNTGCPRCGDNAARLSNEEDLLKRWTGLVEQKTTENAND